jgi:hypothetical protein
MTHNMQGALAEQLRRGLQNLVDGCNSHRCLQFIAISRASGGMVYTFDLKSNAHKA